MSSFFFHAVRHPPTCLGIQSMNEFHVTKRFYNFSIGYNQETNRTMWNDDELLQRNTSCRCCLEEWHFHTNSVSTAWSFLGKRCRVAESTQLCFQASFFWADIENCSAIGHLENLLLSLKLQQEWSAYRKVHFALINFSGILINKHRAKCKWFSQALVRRLSDAPETSVFNTMGFPQFNMLNISLRNLFAVSIQKRRDLAC